eukprot:7399376-Heterocapsa_arctica.AAC.1
MVTLGRSTPRHASSSAEAPVIITSRARVATATDALAPADAKSPAAPATLPAAFDTFGPFLGPPY